MPHFLPQTASPSDCWRIAAEQSGLLQTLDGIVGQTTAHTAACSEHPRDERPTVLVVTVSPDLSVYVLRNTEGSDHSRPPRVDGWHVQP
jgi:hypothetical protein